MKKATLFSLTMFVTVFAFPLISVASELMVPSAMQRCATNDDCALVTNSCADNCGFVPVNKQNIPTLEAAYQQRCGKTMEQNPQCQVNPPMSAACINSRCTIDTAFQNNAAAQDYQSGAFPVPEKAVPSQVPATAAPADDRHGFTAYEMPQTQVRDGSLGQIKIYVPASSPVSGGNYVSIETAPGYVAAPTAPVKVPAPAPAPAPKKAAAPVPAPAPVVTTPAPAPAPVATHLESVPTPPAPTPIANPPTAQTLTPAATATTEATQPAPAPAATVAPAPAPVPTATTTPATSATPANPIPSSANPALPEPRVPDNEQLLRGVSPDTGNVNAPIPPSEFKSQTFVPPAGSTVEVSPEDPGAKPPAGTVLVPPAPRGPEDEEPLTIIQPAP